MDAEVDGGSDGPVGPGPQALQAVARTGGGAGQGAAGHTVEQHQTCADENR